MNTKKLLRLVTEILKNESKFNFQSSLNQLLLNYQQNNPDGVNNMRTEIYDNIKKSDMSRYVNSDFKILKNIEIFGYFDLNIELKIEKILNSQSHEINQKLTNFIQERDTLIQKLTNLQKSLTDL